MVRKLYYEDAYIQEFQARITSIGRETDGRLFIELDQTAFYPTGGGQPCDYGTIHGLQVAEVEEIDGAIRHHLEATDKQCQLSIGDEVRCVIDWNRRFDHMQQHNGQHILSAAIEELYAIPTIGFHMGREMVTIDLDTDKWDKEMADGAEQYANRIVMEDRLITARFVEPEELKAMPLRKPPSVDENIRIVTIVEFDYNPCGGTHPHRTGEVGPIQLFGFESVRGKVRLQFACGMRALTMIQQKKRILQTITQLMTCGEQDLVAKIERLQQERKELEKSNQQLSVKLLDYEVNEWIQNALIDQGIRIVTRELVDTPIPMMQKIAQTITTKEPSSVAVIKSTADKTQIVLARGDSVELDMNVILKNVLEQVNGKGGGSSKMAQGGCIGTIATERIVDTIQSFIRIN
jgi:alanyl-tRNA synthetase